MNAKAQGPISLVDKVWPSKKKLRIQYTIPAGEVSPQRVIAVERSLLEHPQLKHLSVLPLPEYILV